MSKELTKASKIEEIRGLFVLGLLAVLITVKLQAPNGKLDVTIGQLSTNIMPLLENIIILWSFYAFFMVLGLSEDIFGKNFSSGFLQLAKGMLQLNFMFLGVFGVLYAYLAYPTRLPWLLGFILILLVGGAIRFFYSRKNRPTKTKSKINVDLIKRNRIMIVSLMILICTTVILMYPDDWVRLPAFIVGVLSILGYLVWKKEKKAELAIDDPL